LNHEEREGHKEEKSGAISGFSRWIIVLEFVFFVCFVNFVVDFIYV